MGCVTSHTRFPDRNVWDVMNVDSQGNCGSHCRLEITHSDMILHQKGKPCVIWPLKCLRRYGFDTELFSFESGRRCPTGAAVYAFKCRKSFEIFSVLHGFLRAEQATLTTHPNALSPLPLLSSRSHPTRTTAILPSNDRDFLLLQNPINPPCPMPVPSLVARRRHGAFVPTLPQDMLHNWVNSTEPPSSPPPFSDVVTPTYQNFPSGPMYMNVCVRQDRESFDSGRAEPLYVNVNDDHSGRSRQSSSSSADEAANVACHAGDINYVELDLDRNSDSGGELGNSHAGLVPPSSTTHDHLTVGATAKQESHIAESNSQPRSYATIDFEKTAALSTFVNSVPEFTGEGTATRKTRHDSMCPVPRGSVSNE